MSFTCFAVTKLLQIARNTNSSIFINCPGWRFSPKYNPSILSLTNAVTRSLLIQLTWPRYQVRRVSWLTVNVISVILTNAEKAKSIITTGIPEIMIYKSCKFSITPARGCKKLVATILVEICHWQSDDLESTWPFWSVLEGVPKNQHF